MDYLNMKTEVRLLRCQMRHIASFAHSSLVPLLVLCGLVAKEKPQRNMSCTEFLLVFPL